MLLNGTDVFMYFCRLFVWVVAIISSLDKVKKHKNQVLRNTTSLYRAEKRREIIFADFHVLIGSDYLTMFCRRSNTATKSIFLIK